MAAAAEQAVRGEAQVRLRGRPEGGDAARTPAEDHPRPRRHEQQEVPARQARLPRVSRLAARAIADALGSLGFVM